jgi:hypothetical protein
VPDPHRYPTILSAPVYVIGEDELLQPRVEASAMSGLGVIAGAAVGYRVTRHVEISLELRAAIASRWELPGRIWAVPGETAPDGGRMYTTSQDDASGAPRTATVVVRALL